MELSPGRQRLLFAVVVIVLVGLGVFVIRGRNHDSAAAPAPTPTSSPRPAASGAATASGAAAASEAATAVPPATVPPPAPTPTTAGGPNIYQWLPFSQSDLATAARTTLAFARVYANTSYTETKDAYIGKLTPLATAQETATLVSDFETPEIVATRTTGRQVASGTPVIDSISSIGPQSPPGPPGPASITFAVTITQKLRSTSGTLASTPEYTITTVSTANGWQVENIQLASLGNQ